MWKVFIADCQYDAALSLGVGLTCGDEQFMVEEKVKIIILVSDNNKLLSFNNIENNLWYQ